LALSGALSKIHPNVTKTGPISDMLSYMVFKDFSKQYGSILAKKIDKSACLKKGVSYIKIMNSSYVPKIRPK
jgi:hypothetical protein